MAKEEHSLRNGTIITLWSGCPGRSTLPRSPLSRWTAPGTMKLYAACSIGRISAAIFRPASLSARFKSNELCRLSQNCAVVLK